MTFGDFKQMKGWCTKFKLSVEVSEILVFKMKWKIKLKRKLKKKMLESIVKICNVYSIGATVTFYSTPPTLKLG